MKKEYIVLCACCNKWLDTVEGSRAYAIKQKKESIKDHDCDHDCGGKPKIYLFEAKEINI